MSSNENSASAVLAGLVVHWGAPRALGELLEHWPRADPTRPLVVVDNDPSAATAALAQERPDVHFVTPEHNLGFAGGLHRAFAVAERLSPTPHAVLLLNPDVVPDEGALERLVLALDEMHDAAGVVPRLVDDGGEQSRWQLRPLPHLRHLLAQCLYRPGVVGPAEPPPRGTPIEQPAAAALVVRVESWRKLDGFDRAYFPAWFEDVDFAARAARAGLLFRYCPEARFHHALGSSVASLGYDRFLWVYFRSLDRYVAHHHGAAATALTRAVLVTASLLRLALLPLRRPRRAESRGQAARGFAAVALGAATGYRLPRALVHRFTPPDVAAPDGTGDTA